MKKFSVLILFLFILLFGMYGQSDSDSGMSISFDMSGFPQWAKDLRRAEIVAFGCFPFMYFFTNFSVDLYRCIQHDWDTRYAPWPFTGAGAIGKSQSEQLMTIGFAATGAIVIALIDFGIERYKRSVREKELRRLPDGTPIVIRRPLHEDESSTVEDPYAEYQDTDDFGLEDF